MKNKPDSGFSFKGLNKLSLDMVLNAIPGMSCEELLTCRILTNKTAVVRRIQSELAKRVEVGDNVEVVSGYETVVKANNGVIYVRARTQRYGSSTTGFYTSRDVMPVCYYECKLEDVDWSATMVYEDAEHWLTSPYLLTVKARGKEIQIRSDEL